MSSRDDNASAFLKQVMADGEATEAKPRLMIKKLVAENFKSYGGTCEIGPFHKSYSAVVGPNGSGKSNVIDAMLFVFGKRAAQMRLKTLSELIHKSEALPNVSHCAVTVHFALITDRTDSEDAYDIVSGSEFSITRTADQGSVSTYYIDGKQSPMSAVEDKLMSHGIDLKNNRFLILQGEVEQIAMMKPKAVVNAQGNVVDPGLLEYLEDIIGSNALAPAIAVAEASLARHNEHRATRLRKLKLLEADLDAVAKGRDEAIAAFELEHQVLHGGAMRAAVRARRAGMQLDEALTGARVLEEKLNEKREHARETVDALRAKKTELDALAAQRGTLQDTIDEANAEFRVCNEEHVAQRANLQAQITNKQQVSEHEGKISAELAEAVEAHEKHLEKRDPLAKEISKLRADKETLDAEVEKVFQEVKERTKDIKAELEAKEKEMLPLRAVVDGAVAAVRKVENEQKVLREASERRRAAQERLRRDLVTAQEGAVAAEKEVEDCTRRIADCDQGIKDRQQRLQDAGRKREGAIQRRNEAVAHAEVVRESRQHSPAARGHLSTELMKHARTDPNLKGLFGTLGDLATIAPEFDVAISTAAPGLRNFLVDTSRTGQHAIGILRSLGLGRATFICLDKHTTTHAARMAAPVQVPAGARRLFDLISCSDDRFKPAFYSVLRDTLVVDDLDTANRVAYSGSRWRVVTLTGELIDLTGTMAGGGRAVQRGAMALSRGGAKAAAAAKQDVVVTEKDVADAEAEAKRAEHALRALDEERLRLTPELARLAKDKVTMQGQLEAAKDRVGHTRARAAELEARIEAVAAKAAKRTGIKRESTAGEDEEALEELRLNALETELAEAVKEQEKAVRATAALDKEIAAVKQRMLQGGGKKLQELKQKSIELHRTIESKNKELTRITVAIEGFPTLKEKLEDALAQLRAEGAETEAAYTATKATIKRVELKALEVVGKLTELTEKQNDLAASAETVRSEMDVLQEKVDVFRAAEQDLISQIQAAEADSADIRAESEEWTRRLAALTKDISELGTRIVDSKTRVSAVEVWQEARALERAERRQMLEAARAEAAAARERLNAAGGEVAVPRRRKNAKKDAAQTAAEKAAAEAEALAEELMSGDIDDDEDPESLAADEARAREADDSLPPVERPADFECPAAEVLDGVNLAALEARIVQDEKELAQLRNALAGNPIAEYKTQHKDFLVFSTLFQATSQARDAAKAKFDALRTQRLTQFMTGFRIISLKLKEMYQMLTMGGDAELELQDTLDPFAEGIVFSVRPLNKSWKAIQNLSGGEKTLSSLALVFALHHYKPTPLYVMDEIDAALDFKNVSIVANYIKERTKNAQFIIISLRNNMFELADRLVGIYKTHNITKSITIDPRSFAEPDCKKPQPTVAHEM